MRIVNIVITGKFDDQLDLCHLSSALDNCTLNRERFNGAILTYGDCTFLLFATGKFVCLGARTQKYARCCARNLSMLLHTTVHGWRTCNVVGAERVGSRVNLEDFFAWLRASGYDGASLEPELFSGLKIEYLGSTVRLFHNGKFFVTGLKSIKETKSVSGYIQDICKPFVVS